MQINLNPARGPSEPFKIYQSRRRANNIRVKNYLFGRFVWVSCAIRQVKQKDGSTTYFKEPAQGTLFGKCPDRKKERRMF